MLKNHEVNLHTHTPFCHHAVGTPEEYCKAALAAGIKVLGFSEHSPFPDGHLAEDHMSEDDIPHYLSQLEQAQEAVPEVTVLRGIEADWQPDMNVYRRYRERMHLDYILGSAHWSRFKGKDLFFLGEKDFDEETLASFFSENLSIMRSGAADIIAHPDAAACRYEGPCTPLLREKFRELARESRLRNIPIEINQNGLRRPLIDSPEGPRWSYPWETLWQIAAEEDAPVVIGIDAHSPARFTSENRQKLQSFAERLNLRIVNAEFAKELIERKERHG